MSKRLTVTPIGTCRINTPLRRARSRYPVALELNRVYGFTHTSDEALQQLRFMQGDKQFDDRARQLIFDPGREIAADAPYPAQSGSHGGSVGLAGAGGNNGRAGVRQ